MPACHSSSASGTLPHFGTAYPKNCECYRQVRRFGCSEAVQQALTIGWPAASRGGPDYPLGCLLWTALLADFPCYTYDGLPAEQQLSDPPQPSDPRVSWWLVRSLAPVESILPRAAVPPHLAHKLPPPYAAEGLQPQQPQPLQQGASGVGHEQGPGPGLPSSNTAGRRPAEAIMKLVDGTSWLPLDRCPTRCSERARCLSVPSLAPQCSCNGLWQGAACEEMAAHHCYRACSGVGRCVEGWCHCPPGRWGLGCTRDKAYNSTQGWLPRPVGLRIYVYDLPTHVAHSHAVSDGPPLLDELYGAERAFTEALLGDWSVRTQNPWEANMFYVPAWVQWYAGPSGSPAAIYAHLAQWLAGHSPFWNASLGRNHFWFASSDRAGCDVYAPGRALGLQRPIMVTHFGQAAPAPYAALPAAGRSAASQAAQAPAQAPSAGRWSAAVGGTAARGVVAAGRSSQSQRSGSALVASATVGPGLGPRASLMPGLRQRPAKRSKRKRRKTRPEQRAQKGSGRQRTAPSAGDAAAGGQGAPGKRRRLMDAGFGSDGTFGGGGAEDVAAFSPEDLALLGQQCYRPEKDVVAPPHAPPNIPRGVRLAVYEYALLQREGGPSNSTASGSGGYGDGNGWVSVARRSGPHVPQRNVTLLFAGRTRPQLYYSQGVRQAVAALFGPGGRHDPQGPNARPDVLIATTPVVQAAEMRRAKFCLAVTGHGWGVRLVEALLCGCVPVIIQDHTYQPLWDVVPYEEFSVRLARRDMGRLMALLDAISPQQLEALQRGVDKWHRAFLWQAPGDPPGTGLAYHYTLRALERRLGSFKAEHYARLR